MAHLDEILRVLRVPFEHLTQIEGRDKVTVASPTAVLQLIREESLRILGDRFVNEVNRVSVYNDATSESWKLSCTWLDLLVQLRAEVEDAETHQSEEEQAIEVLSVQAQIDFQKLFALILGFGALPYLMPGVGLPSKLRTGNMLAEIFIHQERQLEDLIKFKRLVHVMKTILSVIEHPSIRALILNEKFLCDIIIGILQICKPPLRAPGSGPGTLSQTDYDEVMKTRKEIDELFRANVLTNVSTATLVNALLIVGANEKPKWMSRACQDLMAEVLGCDDKNGLAVTAQSVVNTLGRSNSWKSSKVVINLIKTAIDKEKEASAKAKVLESLCSQAYTLLRHFNERLAAAQSKGDMDNCHEMISTALTIGSVIYDYDSKMALNHFWKLVFKPLLQGSDSPVPAGCSSDKILLHMTSKDVQDCAVFAEKTLKVFQVMESSDLHIAFLPIWSTLLQILVSCDKILDRPIGIDDFDESMKPLKQEVYLIIHQVMFTLFEVVHQESNLKIGSSSSAKKRPGTSLSAIEFCTRLILNERSLSGGLESKCPDSELVEFEIDLEPEVDEVTEELLDIRPLNFMGRIAKGTADSQYLENICDYVTRRILVNERLRPFAKSLFVGLLGHGDLHKFDKEVFIENKSRKKLLTEDEENDIFEKRRFVQMKILGELGQCSEIVEEIDSVDDPEQLMSFLELILKKLVSEIDTCEERGNEYEFAQSSLFALGILATLTENKDSKDTPDEFWKSLERFIPYLVKFRDSECTELMDFGVPDTAETVLIAIRTHGVGTETEKFPPKLSRYESAMQDAKDLQVPIKGHGLLQLRKCVEDKDADALRYEAQIVQTFLREMNHPDSYVFLMAIEGLAAVGSQFHVTVVPALVHEYGAFESSTSAKLTAKMTSEERSDLRMKIGEVLVKVIRKLGELAPLYRQPLTNLFFHVVRDTDPMLRASAMANLGELCNLLGYSLHHVLTEVWSCIESVLTIEKHVVVRRAAAHMLVLLLRGVEKQVTAASLIQDSLAASYLRDARRLITRIHDQEVDQAAKTQFQLAMDELGLIVKKLITPNNNLEYKIRVLDPE